MADLTRLVTQGHEPALMAVLVVVFILSRDGLTAWRAHRSATAEAERVSQDHDIVAEAARQLLQVPSPVRREQVQNGGPYMAPQERDARLLRVEEMTLENQRLVADIQRDAAERDARRTAEHHALGQWLAALPCHGGPCVVKEAQS